MRILIVQFGNHAYAERQLAQGGSETFYAQRYTVDFFSKLVSDGHEVRVLSLVEDEKLERSPSGVESLGYHLFGGSFPRLRMRKLIKLVSAWKPTHLIVQTPLTPLLRWALDARVACLPVLADSFHATGVRSRLKFFQLARVLNHADIRFVANHGPNAAADLVRIGVRGNKVVPFDWPAVVTPREMAAKPAPRNPKALHIVYVGQLTAAKGVGDVIDSIALSKSEGEDFRATIVGGGGEQEALIARARDKGVSDRVTFTGRVAHDRVLALMSEGDVVVVPSHHDYPEGMPMTVYEGLVSRSPVLISDHPMFRGRIEHEKSGMIFEAANPRSLVDCARKLANDAALYERISKQADQTCATFFSPLKWDQLIERWLKATPEDDRWLRQYALERDDQVESSA